MTKTTYSGGGGSRWRRNKYSLPDAEIYQVTTGTGPDLNKWFWRSARLRGRPVGPFGTEDEALSDAEKEDE